MNPRSFLNFLHTRSGKLILFGCLLAFGLFLYSQTRRNTTLEPGATKLLDLHKTNKPQVVETVQRAMEIFRPPPPKPDPKPQPVVTNKPAEVVSAKTPEPPPPPAPLGLFADTTSQLPEPKSLSADYAPYGRLISCESIITVDSSSIRTPIIGLITEDIYHAGRLIIPAGTEVHGTAAPDRVRERLASGTSWTLVWQTGEELRLSGLALDREFESDTNHVGWGITDGSAGLRGRLIKSDNLAEIKLFAATFLSGAANALTEKEQTVFGTIDSRTLNNAPFKGAEKVLAVYAQRIYESIQRDGFYVRVPSGKQFYLYILQTIDRADARIGGTGTVFAQTNEWNQFETVVARSPAQHFDFAPSAVSLPIQP
ncbi:MAG: TrbI/VirB10 family protein [Verrucomicrobiales bacterium]|nr:TrbI/VirB10 family protein [Verrucomicrobiales bacterium]